MKTYLAPLAILTLAVSASVATAAAAESVTGYQEPGYLNYAYARSSSAAPSIQIYGQSAAAGSAYYRLQREVLISQRTEHQSGEGFAQMIEQQPTAAGPSAVRTHSSGSIEAGYVNYAFERGPGAAPSIQIHGQSAAAGSAYLNSSGGIEPGYLNYGFNPGY